MKFPARVVLRSGAVVLLENTSQMEVLPLGVAFDEDGTEPLDGVHVYREMPASSSGAATRFRAELQAACEALAEAAEAIRDSGRFPVKASRTKQAADRAKAVLEEATGA